MLKSILLAFVMLSPVADAGTLTMSLTSADLKVKGDFSLKVGSPLTIQGTDDKNKAYKLTVNTKEQGEKAVMLSYTLDRGMKPEKGAVIVAYGKAGALTVGDEEGPPEVVFEVKFEK